jgi:hypothetical protein
MISYAEPSNGPIVARTLLVVLVSALLAQFLTKLHAVRQQFCIMKKQGLVS